LATGLLAVTIRSTWPNTTLQQQMCYDKASC